MKRKRFIMFLICELMRKEFLKKFTKRNKTVKEKNLNLKKLKPDFLTSFDSTDKIQKKHKLLCPKKTTY